MYEVTIVLTVLAVAAIIGSLIKPNADQLRPLSPDEIGGNVSEGGDHH